MQVTEYKNPSNPNEVAYTCASDVLKGDVFLNARDSYSKTTMITTMTYNHTTSECTGYGNWLNSGGFAQCRN